MYLESVCENEIEEMKKKEEIRRNIANAAVSGRDCLLCEWGPPKQTLKWQITYIRS